MYICYLHLFRRLKITTRKLLTVLTVVIAASLLLNGCGNTLRNLDGSSESRIEDFRTGNGSYGETSAEVFNRLKRENKNLLTENSLLKYELRALKTGQPMAHTEISRPAEPAYYAKEASAPIAIAQTRDIPMQNDLTGIKIKVLSGDGKLSSAKETAKTLQSLGYKIDRVALAPSTKYSKTFIYYAKGREHEAAALADRLGRDTKLKPLSWKSIFDIIVVTKNNQYKKR